MPQLDFANPLTFAQVVWMFLIFAVLYVALRTWALPLVGGVIEERAHRINADLDAARLAKADSDRAVAEVAERSRAASAEAQAKISAAIASTKSEAEAAAQRDAAALDRQLAEAEQRIRAAREQAMGSLRDVAADTAGTVISRLTGHTPDPARVDAAVSELIAARS